MHLESSQSAGAMTILPVALDSCETRGDSSENAYPLGGKTKTRKSHGMITYALVASRFSKLDRFSS